MRSILFLILSTTVLFGCKPPDPPSGPQNASSTTVTNNTVSASLFNNNCSSCHAYQGKGIFNVVAFANVGGTPVSIETLLSKYGSVEGLAKYIEDNMPISAPGGCIGQCASDTAAYMASTLNDINGGAGAEASCQAEKPILYGARSLPPLTASEYRKTVVIAGLVTEPEALALNLPGDVVRTKSDYAVHNALRVEATRATAFDKAAFKIADLATPRLIQNCGNNTDTCTNQFLDLAYMLHRQPLTDDEKQLYRDIFSNFGATAGMRTAIAAALTSPQFIYRSEMGVPVAEALSNGWNTVNSTTRADGFSAGSDGTSVMGENFSNKSTGESAGNGVWNLHSDGTISHDFTFSGKSLVAVEARGNDFIPDNQTVSQWPQMIVTIAGQQVDDRIVQGYDLQTFEYVVDASGNQKIQIEFRGDAGREPYGTPGNDINLYIGKVTVSPAVASSNTTPSNTTPANAPKFDLADADAYVLTPYEFASQLAFMYTGGGPDRQLLQRAANGELNDNENVQRIIDDLIASPAGRSHIEAFGRTWFRTKDVLDESRPSFSDFNADVAADMATEVGKLFAEVWYNDNLTWEDFYAGDFTVVNSRLAAFYGYTDFQGGVNDWQVATIPNRGGILTTGAFHASSANDLHTRPILKAVKLRELMLCHHLGAPQNGLATPEQVVENQQSIVTTLRNKAGDTTAREYYEASTVAEGCQVCHASLINPLFGLDDFDQVGRYRTSQTGLALIDDQGLFGKGNAGVSVDTSGQLIGLAELNDLDVINFNGAKDLAQQIATLPAVAECLVKNSFRYTTGLPIDRASVAKIANTTVREDELTQDQAEDFACAKETLMNTYKNSGKKPMNVYRKIGTLDLVRFRK